MKFKREDIVDAIVKMRIEKGASTKTIIEDFLKGELGYKQSYAYALLNDARIKIREIYDADNLSLLNEALGSLERIYEKAMTDKQHKLALETRKEINKLLGLYKPEKVEHTGSIEIKTIWGDEKDDKTI